MPSMILYLTKDNNYSFDSVFPSVLLLGIVIGNGLLVCYRPLKTSWLYFLINIVSFSLIDLDFDYTIVNGILNHDAVVIVSVIYCALGFLLNLIYFAYFIKRRNKNDFNEKTHNDNLYGFLGGNKRNESVSKQLEQLEDDDGFNKVIKKINSKKLSRVTRIVSFVLTVFLFLVYLILSLKKGGNNTNQLAIVATIAIIVLPITLIASLLYPIDFKYIYYFNAILFLIFGIIASSKYDLHPAFLIIGTVVTFLSFLLTLIVEGRTWSGAKPD